MCYCVTPKTHDSLKLRHYLTCARHQLHCTLGSCLQSLHFLALENCCTSLTSTKCAIHVKISGAFLQLGQLPMAGCCLHVQVTF